MNELKSEVHKVNEGVKYAVFIGWAIICFAVGFYFTPSIQNILTGLTNIVRNSSMADTCYLWLGNKGDPAFFGAAFVNCGIIILCVLATYYMTGTEMGGVQIAALGIVAAYCFYSKNVYNIWPLILGVVIFCVVFKKPLKDYMAIAWFTTALAPIVTTVPFYTPALLPGTTFSIVWGIVFGLVAGFGTAAICKYLPSLHKGYTVFNLGYSTGVIVVMVMCVFRAIGWDHPAQSTGYIGVDTPSYNLQLGIILCIMFGYFILCGLIIEKKRGNFMRILKARTKGSNYVADYGFGATLFNMGVCGFLSLGYVLLTGVISQDGGGQLMGPTYAGIITVAGFAAFGVTLFSYGVLILGVYLTSFVTGGITGVQLGQSFWTAGVGKAAARPALVVSGFVSGLVPVPGDLGLMAGLVAAIFHTLLAVNTGFMHGWMSTYNNGFAGGLVVTFALPLLYLISKKRRHEKLY